MHTCEEGGVQLRFFLAFTDELERQIFIKKLLKWTNKKQNSNVYNAAFFKKNKEKHLEISLFYTCVSKILMIWSTVPEIESVTDWYW